MGPDFLTVWANSYFYNYIFGIFLLFVRITERKVLDHEPIYKTIYKRQTDKNKKYLSVGNFGIMFVVVVFVCFDVFKVLYASELLTDTVTLK